jgi:hypothetical protein
LLEDEDAEYDPAFRSSIANGYMTIGQAKARGDRVYYASRLAQRHGLTSYVAFLVTDNRMPLAEALRRKSAPLAPDAEQNERGLTWAALGLVAAAVCVATVGTTMFLTGGDLDSDLSGRVGGTQVQRPVPVPTVKTASEVHIDPSGEILGIRALDPETVLLAYCQSVRGNNRPSPVRIASTDSGDRLGIFRRGGTLQAILIRKEAGSAYWISSGDNGPIVPVDPTSRASLAAPAGAGG